MVADHPGNTVGDREADPASSADFVQGVRHVVSLWVDPVQGVVEARVGPHPACAHDRPGGGGSVLPRREPRSAPDPSVGHEAERLEADALRLRAETPEAEREERLRAREEFEQAEMARRQAERDAERAAEEVADNIRRTAEWRRAGTADWKVGE